ncbi:hypothetical protein JKP88DRAFT_185579 [Tribonema minus]|uniref:Uncharacterized protein n=1 Tax=Tribonema minus TaxID=303371 RepID=A0A835Z4N7_9STRA|nr:hypothetical protein JKP88DRAFT_68411 [Tribonema minus]KAG5184970.1 hypothetical protein JKP88DRAFT_185579 [Tribonema minus]|eukprot:TRINITY_DN18949_c0_g1_i1.p1 TRINITY_DN18949_c0_g1~~TRINITY_DN18949_c0_g1_i1.p1  ORF type:complete len:126 (-),score=44.98 TRINITY_DN18949_c0_g1_i1:489-866(-)
MAEEAGYDPKRSKVTDEKLAEFIRQPITGELTEVPGIGPAAVKKLAAGEGSNKVANTYQLIGKFLSLKGGDDSGKTIQTIEHCDRFWYWLKEMGISSYRSGIVNAIAEKCNTWIPGIYDEDQYDA